jgi:MFS family permease
MAASFFPRRIESRNRFINIVDGALYITSSGLISAQTFFPALVTRLGGTNVEVGALGVITYLAVFFPQIFAARIVETHPWKKPWAIWMGTSQRAFIFLMGVHILVFGGSGTSLVLWVFLFFFTMNQIMAGIATPGWFDLFAKLIPLKKRGRVIGIRNALGGFGALIAGMLLTWILGAFTYPWNYGIAFMLAFGFQMGSITLQSKLVETEPSKTSKRKPIVSFLLQVQRVPRENREFRRFLIASAFLVSATMPIAFFTVRALKDFHADEALVGAFTLALVGIQGISSLVLGYITDRYGNKLVLIYASAAMGCASLAAILAPSPGWFIVVYLFLGIHLGADVMARYNLSIEYGSAEKRSTYVGLMNTLLAPFYLVGLAGGVLSDFLGYQAVFLGGVIFSLIGLYLLIYKVRDPRSLPRPAGAPIA